MKNKLLIIKTAILLSLFSFAQDTGISWQNCYGGSEEDHVYDIIRVGDAYLIAGSTGSNDGDISFNHGLFDAWLVKLDSSGNLIWEKTFGGSEGDAWRKIVAAEDKNYYLLGASTSSDGDISYDPYPESNDIWVVKIDSVGLIIWDRIIGGNLIDHIESGVLAQDNGVVLFGWTGSQNGDVSVNYGMYDMWLVKISSDGEILWEKSYGTDDFDYGQAMISTSDGGYLIGGTSTIGNYGNITCVPHNINAEAIVVKLDSLGNIEWQNCYGGSGHDGIWGLKETNDGYLLSAYGSSNDGDLSGSGWHGEGDIWVIKIDFIGNIIWQKCFGGSKDEGALILFTTENSEFVFIGSTNSHDGDITNNHSSSQSKNDIWFLKINSEGDIITQKCFGGEGNEFIYTGASRKGENEYVIAASTDFGPSYDVGCTPHGGIGDEDYWIFEIKDTATGITTNYSDESGIKVYPNPGWEYIIFDLPVVTASLKLEEPSHICIFNIFGQQVACLPFTKEETIWDCRNALNGIYFYKLESEGKQYSGKVIIQKQ
ncbi:MAG: T9SS type A sorting domain-containing protein [Bacteroidales bacterium]|nr:T9SS type A sorting domain-containing protein [Bacteroidales bacterium]